MFRPSANIAAIMLLSAFGAQAQVSGPSLPLELPTLPGARVAELPGNLALPDEPLRTTRLVDIRRLVRKHHDLLTLDTRGEAVVRGEVLVLTPPVSLLDRLQASGYVVLRTTHLANLDLDIAAIATPRGRTPQQALRELRRKFPEGVYDYNHIYSRAGAAIDMVAVSSAREAASVPAGTVALGLVDGGVGDASLGFDQRRIQRWGCAGQIVTSTHGTAVASLLVGTGKPVRGVSPGARLYAADVYCGVPTGGNVLALAEAFAWLAANGVPVINISLVGQANATLEMVVGRLVARGTLVVAAVGNDGPAARPLYPAAYPGVIGVTGVDDNNRVLIEACRGSHVAFAAPGINLAASDSEAAGVAVRGTSFAAPLVAGLLAIELEAGDPASARARLAARAQDLGRKGPDEIYGVGLVGADYRVGVVPGL
ncbi:MAG: S8 family serine peptidase [Gammaproteobacteria bacterium]